MQSSNKKDCSRELNYLYGRKIDTCKLSKEVMSLEMMNSKPKVMKNQFVFSTAAKEGNDNVQIADN